MPAEQNAVEPVIIAGGVVAPNLILDGQDHVFFIGDGASAGFIEPVNTSAWQLYAIIYDAVFRCRQNG